MKDRNIPAEFVPYGKIIICSNIIEGGGQLFKIRDTFPLMVGQGDPPLVWLFGVSNPNSSSLKPLVEKSKPLSPLFSVIDAFGGTVIMSKGQKVLSVREIKKDYAEIDFVDLRPAGLNIHGDSHSLKVGGMNLSGNSFSGGGVFVSLG